MIKHMQRGKEKIREKERRRSSYPFTHQLIQVDETIRLTGLVFGAFVGYVSTLGAD